VIETGTGVTVALEVLVNAGKINVIAGKGTSVVVGVTVGVEEGVKVRDGVCDVPVVDCVYGLDVADPVTRNITSA
jgi:hypothetical protein